MKKLVYKIKKGARLKGLEPDVVAAELNRIAEQGELTAESVLSAASKKRNPLHGFFEWDDRVAARQYRLKQASYLVGAIEVEVTIVDPKTKEPTTVTTRAYHSMGNGIEDGKNSKFHHSVKILSDHELRNQLVRRIWNELLSMRQRYESFLEFESVWLAIDNVHQHAEKEVRKTQAG